MLRFSLLYIARLFLLGCSCSEKVVEGQSGPETQSTGSRLAQPTYESLRHEITLERLDLTESSVYWVVVRILLEQRDAIWCQRHYGAVLGSLLLPQLPTASPGRSLQGFHPSMFSASPGKGALLLAPLVASSFDSLLSAIFVPRSPFASLSIVFISSLVANPPARGLALVVSCCGDPASGARLSRQQQR
jgi:hypothetical protein